jgi:hypothetical protein
MTPTERVTLLNGTNFEGWDFHLGNPDAKPAETWSVKDGAVHCTGKPAGYMRTKQTYANYLLHVEWRWAGKPGNSGVLVHMSPPDKVWPKSIEAQLMNRNAGDFFVIGGTDFKEHRGKQGRRTPKKTDSNEKEIGEWNTMEVTCAGDSITVVVNGETQNIATETTVTEGHICLQSEGAPIEFRNVYLDPVP